MVHERCRPPWLACSLSELGALTQLSIDTRSFATTIQGSQLLPHTDLQVLTQALYIDYTSIRHRKQKPVAARVVQ